jgi:hypothetical protein
MGALEFMPDIDRGETTGKIDIKALSDLAEKIQIERENASISPTGITHIAIIGNGGYICRRTSA